MSAGSSTLVTGISELVTSAGTTTDPLGLRHDAALVAQGGRIAWVGPSGSAPAADRQIDLGGRAVLPGFVDSHAHLVFAGDRAREFAARMAGERYDGGGITVSVEATRAASDDELRALVGTIVGSHGDDPLKVADALVTFANDAGGHDNITAVLARVPRPGGHDATTLAVLARVPSPTPASTSRT